LGGLLCRFLRFLFFFKQNPRVLALRFRLTASASGFPSGSPRRLRGAFMSPVSSFGISPLAMTFRLLSFAPSNTCRSARMPGVRLPHLHFVSVDRALASLKRLVKRAVVLCGGRPLPLIFPCLRQRVFQFFLLSFGDCLGVSAEVKSPRFSFVSPSFLPEGGYSPPPDWVLDFVLFR